MIKLKSISLIQFAGKSHLRWGCWSMLTMCMVYIILALTMWECKSGYLFQVARAIFFLLGYPSKLIFDLLVNLKLVNMHNLVALFTVIFVWYLFFGFLLGLFFRYILDISKGRHVHHIETDRRNITGNRISVYVIFIMLLLLNWTMSSLILYQKLNFSYVFVKFHCGIYLLRNCLVIFLSVLSMGMSFLLLWNKRKLYFLSICLSILPAFWGLFSMIPNSNGKMCKAHLYSLWAACLYYTDTHQGNYPEPEKWCDVLKDYVGSEIFLCPSNPAPTGRCNYAINKYIRKGIFSDVVLFYDSIEGWNLSGGVEKINPNNHNKGCYVIYIDGSLDFIRVEDFDKIRWK